MPRPGREGVPVLHQPDLQLLHARQAARDDLRGCHGRHPARSRRATCSRAGSTAFADGKPAATRMEWTALKSSQLARSSSIPTRSGSRRSTATTPTSCGRSARTSRTPRPPDAFANWNRGWIKVVERHVSAWAHVEHGIGMHVYLPAQRDAPTNMINNALAVAAAHKLRFGQDIILYNLELLRARSRASTARPTRRPGTATRSGRAFGENVEEITGIRDWAEAFFAATVVFEPLVGELFRSEFVMQDAAPAGRLRHPDADGRRRVRHGPRRARLPQRCSRCWPTTPSTARRTARIMQGWLNEWAPKSLAAGRAAAADLVAAGREGHPLRGVRSSTPACASMNVWPSSTSTRKDLA